jgi:hypothetical protein
MLTTLANIKQWLRLTGRPITGITKASPGVVACVSHGLVSGQQVMLSGVLGMTAVNGVVLTVTVITADSFSIGVDTSTYGAYTSGGVVGADDVLLTRLANAVSGAVTLYCNRELVSAERTETYTCRGGQVLPLRNYPITAVKELVVDGVEIDAYDEDEGVGYHINNSLLELTGYTFSSPHSTARQNVSVTYTAGYATIPYEIEQAVVNMVALRYREMDRIGQRSKILGGETVNYTVFDMPPDVKAILDGYRDIKL